LHPELLEDLGRRVLRLFTDPQWQNEIIQGTNRNNQAGNALMHADKISREMRWRLEELVGLHPDEMPPAFQALFLQPGGLEMLSADKLPPHLRSMFRELAMYGVHSNKFSGEVRNMLRRHQYHEGGEWIMVNGRFAAIYMSALAALLSREVQVSALTNEEPASGVNLRCLVDDVAASGETAARGTLVSVIIKSLKIDPKLPVRKLIAFRRGRKEQIAELSGHFDDLKGKIEKASSSKELEESAKRLFENKIRPSLKKLKKELEAQSIQSVWDGVQRGFTVSAASSGVLVYVTGYTGPMLLGAAAFITLADVGVKSYLARSRVRASSPYTYLLDVERKFVLPS
jgi:hypothetical protein